MEIEEFQALIGKSYELKSEITALDDQKKELGLALKDLDMKILDELERMGVNSFKSRHGTISRVNRTSVKTPKTHEDKQAFFNWLMSTKGDTVYWQYASVNSQALNSFYKAEYEVAKEEGNFDFEIPGIGEPELTPIISRRKK